ncbi:hypothetical protein BDA96_01G558200 [Sorghum bicolor]|jgi:hypothetical protein|uniref:Uncharacterized protein n=2 Tax=Sorghum bicolor TaxID=4558 RepID=A0A1B6QQT5_SORBI|nr:uncharacterized protein LOC110431728 [Sorghum bicolor]KAG0553010.1 hypothetical protein BDA96_01G558200 [Sorghum bicolor]KXG40284.1 hypothetical protein SORBI_3001G523000 [Sorghum bicolor]|eukprot:XP_021306848.1 uncharacterized protein LOC110431728 [Sorghum bicolor]
MAQREARAGAADKAAAGGGAGHVTLEMGGGVGELRAEQRATTTTWACGAVAAAVVGVGLAGAGVLVWWALAFHPARQQLWMVPVGLVLLGTPLLAWLSIFASDACRWFGRLRDHQPPLVRPAPDPER